MTSPDALSQQLFAWAPEHDKAAYQLLGPLLYRIEQFTLGGANVASEVPAKRPCEPLAFQAYGHRIPWYGFIVDPSRTKDAYRRHLLQIFRARDREKQHNATLTRHHREYPYLVVLRRNMQEWGADEPQMSLYAFEKADVILIWRGKPRFESYAILQAADKKRKCTVYQFMNITTEAAFLDYLRKGYLPTEGFAQAHAQYA